MTLAFEGQGALDYYPCRYGKSRLLFRGPKRNLDKPYVAFLGGTETYGRFIEKPFPALVEQAIGCQAVNFGYMNAGIDVFKNDTTVLKTCNRARATVIQVMGAQNMSNRFYTVHPRRNDRFIKASLLLETIFREVDFTDFNFTRHMLSTLLDLSPERFVVVVEELRAAWMARMTSLIEAISGPVVLVWFADRAPEQENGEGLGADPLFITREMLDDLSSEVAAVIEVPVDGVEDRTTDGMQFAPMEVTAAHAMLGLPAHAKAAAALENPLKALI